MRGKTAETKRHTLIGFLTHKSTRIQSSEHVRVEGKSVAELAVGVEIV